MSHFSVLVVTKTPEEVEAVLQPYHEYECTGTNDEYVVWVDQTEEITKEFNELSSDTKSYDSIEAYARSYYGYDDDNFRGDEIGNITNPNAKWDWWKIGGRWSGFLKPKDPSVGTKGEPGLMGSEYDAQGVDQCVKSNVDFETRMAEKAEKAAIRYDEVIGIINGREWLTWTQCREAKNDDINNARELFNGQAVIKELKKFDDSPFEMRADFKQDRETYIKSEADASIATFAIVMDGKWYERGDMGWFGCVSDEKDQSAWSTEFKTLLDTIPDDMCLTVVDCHI